MSNSTFRGLIHPVHPPLVPFPPLPRLLHISKHHIAIHHGRICLHIHLILLLPPVHRWPHVILKVLPTRSLRIQTRQGRHRPQVPTHRVGAHHIPPCKLYSTI